MGLSSVIPELYEKLKQVFQASRQTRYGQARSFPSIVHRTLCLGITTLPNPPKFRRPPFHHLLQLSLFGGQSRTVHAHRMFRLSPYIEGHVKLSPTDGETDHATVRRR